MDVSSPGDDLDGMNNRFRESRWRSAVDLILQRSDAIMKQYYADATLMSRLGRRLEWCGWMLRGGWQHSDDEIRAKIREYFPSPSLS